MVGAAPLRYHILAIWGPEGMHQADQSAAHEILSRAGSSEPMLEGA